MLAAALAALWVANCSGPSPEVTDVRLFEPPTTGAGGAGDPVPYHVQATVRNRGHGHGEVVVTLRLRDPVADREVQTEEHVVLGPYESALVVAELSAPPGRYQAAAEAQYPPE